MVQQRIGMVITAADSAAALGAVEDLDNRGVGAAWMTSGSTGGGDSVGVFTAAGPRTRSIMFGTAITQTFPRHPIAVAQQVLTLAQLAPGRFRLGLGTSGQGGVEQTLGINFRAPLAHLREYVRILKALLQEGSVDYSGRYYQAHTNIPAPVDVPVMAAALGGGCIRDVRGRNRRRHQLGVSGRLPAGRCHAGHAAWGGAGRSRHASSGGPCAGVRSRRPR